MCRCDSIGSDGREVGQASCLPLEFGHFETSSRRPPVHRWSDGTRHIAHWALLIAHCSFWNGPCAVAQSPVDPLLDESIELPRMLGELSQNTTNPQRSGSSRSRYQCPMSNAQ